MLAGLTPKKYRYFDNSSLKLNINGLLEDLDKAENGSIIVLHACAHNPTGSDPSKSQWEDILKVMYLADNYAHERELENQID
jgi:aspartate/tyrosine/aromatic aminotransferase